MKFETKKTCKLKAVGMEQNRWNKEFRRRHAEGEKKEEMQKQECGRNQKE